MDEPPPNVSPLSHLRLPEQPDHYIDYEVLDYTVQDRVRRVPVYASPEHLAHLVNEGWLMCEQALSADQVTRFRATLDRATEAEKKSPDATAWGKSGLTIRWLHYKAPEFFELLRLQGTLSIARAVLGPQVQLGCFQGRVVDPDSPGREIPWHIHHRVVPKPLPAWFAYPHAVHCLFYLDDVHPESGAISLLPGSHLRIHDLYPAPDTIEKPGQVDLYPKAGDCLLIHGNLWHKVKPSLERGPIRRMITCGYLPSWIRLDTVVGDRPPFDAAQILQDADPELRELFGEFCWH